MGRDIETLDRDEEPGTMSSLGLDIETPGRDEVPSLDNSDEEVHKEPNDCDVPESQAFVVTLPRSRHYEPKVMEAKIIELEKFDKFSAYKIVPVPKDRKVLGTN